MRIEISDPGDPRLALYRGVADPGLLAREGRFVAEGRLVVRRRLESPRFEVELVLVTPAAFADMADALETAAGRVPVYVASRELLVAVAGFNIHRGCLALGRRPAPADAATVLPGDDGRAVVVAREALANADNVGGIFRNARRATSSGSRGRLRRCSVTGRTSPGLLPRLAGRSLRRRTRARGRRATGPRASWAQPSRTA